MPGSSFRTAASFFCLLLPLALVSCSRDGGVPRGPVHPSAPVSPAPAQPANTSANAPTGDQVLLSVSNALRSGNLLTRPDRCYTYRFDPAAGQSAYIVDVMENHAYPECGGDPQTQPHLLTVHVDKQTGAISQDGHAPGDFQPLRP